MGYSKEGRRTLPRRGLLFPFASITQERNLAEFNSDWPEKTLGNMQLKVVTTGHTKFHWERNGEAIAELIPSFDALILEYFPPEWKEIEADPKFSWMVDFYRENNYLYYQLEKVAHEQGKQVWVTDPAYCLEFAGLRAVRVGVPLSAGSGILYAIIRGINFKRREAALAALATSAAGVFHLEDTNTSYHLEDDIRNAISAELTLKLAKHMTGITKVLKITTEGHWVEERRYLEDRIARGTKMAMFQPILRVPPMSKLAVARRHIPQGSQWKKIEELSL